MATEGTAVVRGVDIHWRRAGTGPALVWGHGLTNSMESEDRLGIVDHDHLSAQLDLVRYDARGHGRSGVTEDRHAYSWDQMALDQLGLAAILGIGRYIAAGASLGAATALHAAVVAPERVEALVLVIPPTGWETRAAQTDRYDTMADIVLARGTAPLIRGLDAVPVPDPYVGDAGRRAHQEQLLREADPQRLAAVFRGATTANLPGRDAVAAVAAPTLVLAWSGDPGHPESSARELHDLIAGSQLHIASTAADMDTWSDRIVDFVRGVATAET